LLQQKDDDGKYVVEDQPGLEHVPQPLPQDHSGYASAAELPASTIYYPGYTRIDQNSAPLEPVAAPAYNEFVKDKHGFNVVEAEKQGKSRRRRVCGLRAALFWSIIAVIIVIIIAAVAGGVATAEISKSKKSSSSASSPSTVGTSGSGSSSALGTTGSNPTATSSSSAAVIKQNVASSISGSTDYSSLQLQTFSQDLTSGNITYRLYNLLQKGWQPVQQAALTVAPKVGTPLTAVTQFAASSNTTFLNLFYLTGSSSTDIAMANMTCLSTSASCTVTSNGIITGSTTYPVNPSSGLAAVYGQFGWRVYYAETDGTIIEALLGKDAWEFGVPLSAAKTAVGSSIAALVAPPTGINVYYVDQSNDLATLVYPGGWKCKHRTSCTMTMIY
jgi:hypothetical protein